MYRRWRRCKKPKPGIHGRPPFPCTVDCREPEPAVKGSLRRAKLRRALDHRLRFPRKITEKRERGALGHRLDLPPGISARDNLESPVLERGFSNEEDETQRREDHRRGEADGGGAIGQRTGTRTGSY